MSNNLKIKIDMKKNFLIYTLVLMGLILTITNSCKKNDDNNSSSAVADMDGNVYHTVTIGTQTWMVENLKTTTYKDGTAILLVTDNTAWSNLTSAGYSWYNNDAPSYKSLYV